MKNAPRIEYKLIGAQRLKASNRFEEHVSQVKTQSSSNNSVASGSAIKDRPQGGPEPQPGWAPTKSFAGLASDQGGQTVLTHHEITHHLAGGAESETLSNGGGALAIASARYRASLRSAPRRNEPVGRQAPGSVEGYLVKMSNRADNIT